MTPVVSKTTSLELEPVLSATRSLGGVCNGSSSANTSRNHHYATDDDGNEGSILQRMPSAGLEFANNPPPDEDATEAEKSVFDSAPNGGLGAWIQVSGSVFIYFNSWGIINSFGVFESYYSINGLSNKSESQIAWIGSIQAFLLVLVSVFSGPIFDRGYFRSLLIFGSVVSVFGMMMTSLCTEYWQTMLAQGIVVGIGTGCLFIPAIAILAQYFTTRLVFANGLVAAGSSLGGVIYPIIFHRLEPRIGFAWTTRVIAFIMLVTYAYALSVMRIRYTPKFKRALWDQTAFSDVPFVLFTFVVFFVFAGAYVPYYYAQSYAESQGIFSENVSFYMLSILNAGSIFGRIIPNFIADKVGPLNVMFPFTVLTMIDAFCWMAVSSPAGMVIFVFSYGVFSGAFVSLPPPVMAALCPDMRLLGTRMGMSFSVSGLGLLIGTPVGGALLKTPASYVATSAFCGGVVAAALLFMILSRYAKVGWDLKAFI
ncbi:major facilitator superfamily domain-containing protein [Limtongia smithiae]|uniref:major facilitator superfamily domain-containing protein n=1 Tax=Limtongia smithiae TaxID=1125753 RepID=UPI0034CE47AA